MPITSRVDVDAGLVTHSVTEAVRAADIVRAFDMVGFQPGYRPDMNVLWDLSEADAAGAGSDDVKAVIGAIGQRLAGKDGHKVAIAASHDFVYGLARMYEALAAQLPIELRVFRASEAALEWLTGRST